MISLLNTARLTAAAALLSLAHAAAAQAPAGAPAGASGICKDGTYSTAVSKDGACRGHKGVQTWYSGSTTTSTTTSSRKSKSAATAPAMLNPGPAASPSMPAPSRAASPSMPAPAPAASRATSPPPQAMQQSGTQAAAPQPTAPQSGRPNISAERAKLTSMQPAAGGGPGLVWVNGSSKVYHCSGSEFYGKTKTGAYMSESDAKAKGAHPDHNKPCS